VTTILHIEDDPSLSELVRDAFEAFGFRGTYLVATTVDAGRAILGDVAKYPRLDLIISDMHLPDGTGLELVRSARSNPSRTHVPIVMLSGDTDAESVGRAYALGANSYVSKGIRGRSPSETMSALYEHWLKDARLPTPPLATRTQQFIAREVRTRSRKCGMYMRIGEQLGPSEGAFWMDIALRDGNLANVLAFLQGQLGERELPRDLLDDAEAMEVGVERELDNLEREPVRTNEDAQHYLLVLVSNIHAEVIARVTSQLFPIVPVATGALRTIAVTALEEIAAWIDAHADDARLREQSPLLRAAAVRVRG
jgi:CheY-like chemotaxis protein